MYEWAKKLFSEPATLGIILSSAVVGLVSGVTVGAAQYRHGGFYGAMRAVALGVGVAVIVGLGVTEYVSSEPLKLAIVGASAVIAEDVWEGLKTFGRGMATDPLGYISRVVNALRGNSAHGGDKK